MVVRFATWNVGHRFGEHERRLEALIETLRDEQPDIVCLQEVWAMEGSAGVRSGLGVSALDVYAKVYTV